MVLLKAGQDGRSIGSGELFSSSYDATVFAKGDQFKEINQFSKSGLVAGLTEF